MMRNIRKGLMLMAVAALAVATAPAQDVVVDFTTDAAIPAGWATGASNFDDGTIPSYDGTNLVLEFDTSVAVDTDNNATLLQYAPPAEDQFTAADHRYMIVDLEIITSQTGNALPFTIQFAGTDGSNFANVPRPIPGRLFNIGPTQWVVDLATVFTDAPGTQKYLDCGTITNMIFLISEPSVIFNQQGGNFWDSEAAYNSTTLKIDKITFTNTAPAAPEPTYVFDTNADEWLFGALAVDKGATAAIVDSQLLIDYDTNAGGSFFFLGQLNPSQPFPAQTYNRLVINLEVETNDTVGIPLNMNWYDTSYNPNAGIPDAYNGWGGSNYNFTLDPSINNAGPTTVTLNLLSEVPGLGWSFAGDIARINMGLALPPDFFQDYWTSTADYNSTNLKINSIAFQEPEQVNAVESFTLFE